MAKNSLLEWMLNGVPYILHFKETEKSKLVPIISEIVRILRFFHHIFFYRIELLL